MQRGRHVHHHKLRSPSVVLNEQRVSTGRAQAVVCNSGVANACVGEQGMKDAIEMAALAARRFDLDPELVLPMSTGPSRRRTAYGPHKAAA